MGTMKIFSLILLSFLLLTNFSEASAQQLEKAYNDWSVFSLQNKGEKMCYIASTPKKKTGNYKQRGEPYLLVTHRSKTVDEVSVSAGYPYKDGSSVSLAIDKKDKFNLFTTIEVPEVAWAKDSAEDEKIVTAIKKGKELVAKGESKLGSKSSDTYSLNGFSRAYKHMKSLCK